MNTKDEISSIVKQQYNDFCGAKMTELKILHKLIRNKVGDKQYLVFLKNNQKQNPRPVYKIPEQFKNNNQ